MNRHFTTYAICPNCKVLSLSLSQFKTFGFCLKCEKCFNRKGEELKPFSTMIKERP